MDAAAMNVREFPDDGDAMGEALSPIAPLWISGDGVNFSTLMHHRPIDQATHSQRIGKSVRLYALK
jgi:hypothetical protein